jgi:predicted nucleic acid-binding protein
LKQITLDTGPICLYFAKSRLKTVDELFNSLETAKNHAFIIAPILIEVYTHLCVASGKDFANSALFTLYRLPFIEMTSLDPSIILNAGQLKCRYRKKLSYNDCFLLAFALLRKYEVHTTEKDFPMISNLKIITYNF